jgi:hypothetical protein
LIERIWEALDDKSGQALRAVFEEPSADLRDIRPGDLCHVLQTLIRRLEPDLIAILADHGIDLPIHWSAPDVPDNLSPFFHVLLWKPETLARDGKTEADLDGMLDVLVRAGFPDVDTDQAGVSVRNRGGQPGDATLAQARIGRLRARQTQATLDTGLPEAPSSPVRPPGRL